MGKRRLRGMNERKKTDISTSLHLTCQAFGKFASLISFVWKYVKVIYIYILKHRKLISACATKIFELSVQTESKDMLFIFCKLRWRNFYRLDNKVRHYFREFYVKRFNAWQKTGVSLWEKAGSQVGVEASLRPLERNLPVRQNITLGNIERWWKSG